MTAAEAGWRAGVAEREITPPLGTPLTGYPGWLGGCTSVHDPLFVRALALAAPSGDLVVIVATDLLTLAPQSLGRIRLRTAHLVPSSRLLICHSHTHAAPAAADLEEMGAPDPVYCRRLESKLAEVVADAVSRLEPARLLVARARAAIGVNRRLATPDGIALAPNDEGPTDPTVTLLGVESPAGKPLACWFAHGTHATSLSRDNTAVSADWPGAAAAEITRVLGCPALFAQGCSGDVDPRVRGSAAAIAEAGSEVGAAVLGAWSDARPLSGRSANGLRRVVQAAGRAEVELQALAIGDLALLGVAGEPFAALGEELRRGSPFDETAVLGCCNAAAGYLPDPAAFASEQPGRRGYEVEQAHLLYRCPAPTAAATDLVVAAAHGLLLRLHASASLRLSDAPVAIDRLPS